MLTRYDKLLETAWQPIVGIAVYLLVNFVLRKAFVKKNHGGPKAEKEEKKQLGSLDYFVFLHNLVMCIYSGVTFYLTFNFMADKWSWDTIYKADCSNTIFSGVMIDLSWWFYLSKYYEFMDTWLVYLKGRHPIFLQKYHHIGAVIIMWSIYWTETEQIWTWVLFNSFIHTIMYFYYALTSLAIKPPFKSIITKLQLVQFFAGYLIGLPYFQLECFKGASFASVLVNYIYITILMVLFFKFYISTYFAKDKKPQQKTEDQPKQE